MLDPWRCCCQDSETATQVTFNEAPPDNECSWDVALGNMPARIALTTRGQVEDLVRTFVERSLRGVRCEYVDLAVGRPAPAEYFLDRRLSRFIVRGLVGDGFKVSIPLRHLRVVDPDLDVDESQICHDLDEATRRRAVVLNNCQRRRSSDVTRPAVCTVRYTEQAHGGGFLQPTLAPPARAICLVERSVLRKEAFQICMRGLNLFALEQAPARRSSPSKALDKDYSEGGSVTLQDPFAIARMPARRSSPREALDKDYSEGGSASVRDPFVFPEPLQGGDGLDIESFC